MGKITNGGGERYINLSSPSHCNEAFRPPSNRILAVLPLFLPVHATLTKFLLSPLIRRDSLLSKAGLLTQEEKTKVICEFEEQMKDLKHKHCICCHQVRLKMTVNKFGLCRDCEKKNNPSFYLEHNLLPVWYKNGDVNSEPQHHQPTELKDLSIAEKLLIQQVSPFVPLQHIRKGTFGLRGHVCAFEQNIEGLVTKLPRDKNSVEIIQVQQMVRSEIGSDAFQLKNYKVSRIKILRALKWLKQHNQEYKNIQIDMTALDWIGESDSGYLHSKTILVEEDYDDKIVSIENHCHEKSSWWVDIMWESGKQTWHELENGLWKDCCSAVFSTEVLFNYVRGLDPKDKCNQRFAAKVAWLAKADIAVLFPQFKPRRSSRFSNNLNRESAAVKVSTVTGDDDSDSDSEDDNSSGNVLERHGSSALNKTKKAREMELKEDLGPQGHKEEYLGDCITETGYIDIGGRAQLSEEDRNINDTLQKEVASSKNKKNISIQWPEISEIPINEYGDKKIFVLAFPWLFPGGIGDPTDFQSQGTLGDWGSMMLYYEDARFATDRIFAFYALNYILRKRNSSGGSWFIHKFQQDCPESLDELQERIKNGDTAFINSLTYYSRRIQGSNTYWMNKRSELYAWINHHVEAGNGAPMFFITLSCAEHFWADVARLLKERMEMAGLDSSSCEIGAEGFAQLVNDFSIVIQEYFQERVVVWLDTVGKEIFGIKHYWIRYEFAPGRGQIHAHLLAITDDQSIYEIAHNGLRQGEDHNDAIRAEIFHEWAARKFGLTASVDDDFNSFNVRKEENPTLLRFCEVEHTAEGIRQDKQRLMKAVQLHDCSNFCMRPGKGKK